MTFNPIFLEPAFREYEEEDEYEIYEENNNYDEEEAEEIEDVEAAHLESLAKKRVGKLERIERMVFRRHPYLDGIVIVSPNHCSGVVKTSGKTPGERRNRNLHQLKKKLFRIGHKRHRNGVMIYSPNYCSPDAPWRLHNNWRSNND